MLYACVNRWMSLARSIAFVSQLVQNARSRFLVLCSCLSDNGGLWDATIHRAEETCRFQCFEHAGEIVSSVCNLGIIRTVSWVPEQNGEPACARMDAFQTGEANAVFGN